MNSIEKFIDRKLRRISWFLYINKDKKKSENVMNEFMEKLENNHFDRTEPQIGEEFNPTEEVINQNIKEYKKLLNSKLMTSLEEEQNVLTLKKKRKRL